jgi:hypothetical protein
VGGGGVDLRKVSEQNSPVLVSSDWIFIIAFITYKKAYLA